MAKTVYLKPDASGSNNGTSWENAYTSASTAVSSLATGDTLLMDGEITDGLPTIINKNSITIDGGQGPSGQTRIMGILAVDPGDITDEGSGIYSFTTSQPPTITWDYKRDDADGTVTGVTTRRSDITAMYSNMSAIRRQVSAYYGHLPRNATFATTSPTEGRWSYTGGKVYVNPPGTPNGTEFAEKVGVGTTDRAGIELTNCDNCFIRNIEIVGFGNPLPQNGAIYTNGCRFLTIENVECYDSGYRAFNLEGNTGVNQTLGHRVNNCLAAGDCIVGSNTNIPYVVYNLAGASDADCILNDCSAILYPWLGVDGSPILGSTDGDTPMSQEFKPSVFYSHAGPGNNVGNIKFFNVSMLSMCQPLNEKHNIGMFWNDEKISAYPDKTALPSWDETDVDAYPVQFIGGIIYGTPGNHVNTALRRMKIIVPEAQGTLTDYTFASTGKTDWVLLSNTNSVIYYESCEILLRRKNTSSGGCWRSIADTNRLFMDLCTVVYDCPTVGFDTDRIYHRAGGSPSAVNTRFRQTVFAQIGTSSVQRQFIFRGGSPPSSGVDYPALTYDGLETNSCWFFQCGTTLFYRGGSVSADGTTYDSYVARPGVILPENYRTDDPGFVDAPNNNITPTPGGSLASTTISIPDVALENILGIDNKRNSGRYGARQGGSNNPVSKLKNRMSTSNAVSI